MKNKIYISVVLIICFSFVIFGNYKTNQISDLDNRNLLEIPKNLPFETFGNRFENYLKDRIAFREDSIKIYTKYFSILFDELQHSTYEEGKEEHYFFKLSSEEYSDIYINSFTKFLKEVNIFSKEQRNIPFIVWFNPSKIYIYEEYLPEGYVLNRDRSKHFLKGIKDNGIPLIDTTEVLKKESKKRLTFNKKHDVGHWNNFGAFIGFSEFLETQRKIDVNIKPLTIDEFEVKSEYIEKLWNSSLKINEEVPVFKRKKTNAEAFKFEGTILNEKYNNFEYFKNKKPNAGKKLLIFRGSYLNEKLDYIADRYSEVVSIHNYHNISNLIYYYNIFKPDIIAFEVAEYTIKDSYFPKMSMEKFVSLPTYDKVLNFSNLDYEVSNIDYTVLTDKDVTNFLLSTDIKFDYGYLIIDGEEFIIHENLMENDFSYMTSLKTESYNTYRDKKSKFKLVLVQDKSETKVEFDLEF